ncbi:MAG: biopolymer transporter ExbD [Pirellulales bacterium]
MRPRTFPTTNPAKVEQQMTPLIDIVFQLLAFFILTFQVARLEGDFSQRMPRAASGADIGCGMSSIRVRLLADPHGELVGIQLGDLQLPDIAALHECIIAIVGTDTGPGSLSESAEVELQCDYNLHYRHSIAAIAAVSGYVGPSRRIVKLIDKVRFVPPQRGAEQPR